MKRRRRSELTVADAQAAFAAIASKVIRFGETSDASMFSLPTASAPAFDNSSFINVQLMVEGSFGAADDLFEAIRVLRGSVLPAKAKGCAP